MTYITNNFGNTAAEQLASFVEMKWFRAGPRVREWQGSLAAAYSAVFEDDYTRLIPLPDGATGPDGETEDTADGLLNNFNDWLGRDAVWVIYKWTLDDFGLCDHEYEPYCDRCTEDEEVTQ